MKAKKPRKSGFSFSSISLISNEDSYHMFNQKIKRGKAKKNRKILSLKLTFCIKDMFLWRKEKQKLKVLSLLNLSSHSFDNSISAMRFSSHANRQNPKLMIISQGSRNSL